MTVNHLFGNLFEQLKNGEDFVFVDSKKDHTMAATMEDVLRWKLTRTECRRRRSTCLSRCCADSKKKSPGDQ